MSNHRTLVGIFSHAEAKPLVDLLWPYYTLADCPIWGIGRIGQQSNFTGKRVWKATVIGTPGYARDGNLCQRLVDAAAIFLGMEEFTHLCLIESDAIFTRSLAEVEHPGGIVTFQAGGPSEGFRSSAYYHTPWWFDKETALKIVTTGTELLARGWNEEGFPDRFVGLICDAHKGIEIHQSNTFSMNALDTPERIGAALSAMDRHCFYVHGVKNAGQLDKLQNALVDVCECPNCGYWIPDHDGFGCVAHIQPVHKMGCGYCSHPNSMEGLCGICQQPVN